METEKVSNHLDNTQSWGLILEVHTIVVKIHNAL